MAKAASGARLVLGEATARVASFLKDQICPDGGTAGRDGRSDLYYSVFGLGGLCAVGGPLPRQRVKGYLESVDVGQIDDLVHLAAYIRCCAMLCLKPDPQTERLLGRFRSGDGGFADSPDSAQTSVYSCFLGLGAYQDLALTVDNKAALLDYLRRCRVPGKGYANRPGSAACLVGTTSAGLCLGHYLGLDCDKQAVGWLLNQYRHGGFVAAEGVQVPDLLSTATALHSLRLCGMDVGNLRARCLDYVDSLWSGRGGFYGSWFDDVLECEYTYYGLLALGNLAD